MHIFMGVTGRRDKFPRFSSPHLQALVGDGKYVRGAEVSMGLLKRAGQTPTLLSLRGECLLYTGNTEAAKKCACRSPVKHFPTHSCSVNI